MNPKENKRAPKRTTRFIVVNAGSPTRRESHGDGTLIVVSKGTKLFPKEVKEHPSKEGQSIQDTGMQGREEEFPLEKGMRNAKRRPLPGNSP